MYMYLDTKFKYHPDLCTTALNCFMHVQVFGMPVINICLKHLDKALICTIHKLR